MGYLNNNTIVVEAILTKKGREIMSKGGTLNITRFALADDEIDYSLWQGDHPLGTNYYGTVIENMPITEATPDESQIMRYKLVTLPKSTTTMPLLSVPASIRLGRDGDEYLVAPTTRYFIGDAGGYTAILHNSNYGYLEVVSQVDQSVVPVIPTFLRDDELNQSLTAVGRSFKIISKNVSPYISSGQTHVQTQLTIVGNDTGATKTIPVSIYSSLISTNTAVTVS